MTNQIHSAYSTKHFYSFFHPLAYACTAIDLTNFYVQSFYEFSLFMIFRSINSSLEISKIPSKIQKLAIYEPRKVHPAVHQYGKSHLRFVRAESIN